MKRLFRELYSERAIIYSRITGHVLLALLCLLYEPIGELRFVMAGLLLFVVAPAVFFISRHFSGNVYTWRDLGIDLGTIVLFALLSPENWHVILLVGVVVTLAPSVGVQEHSSIIYSCAFTFLLVGMAAAGVIGAVPDWQFPIIVLTAIGPSVIFYAHWQKRAADHLRDRAQAHDSLMQVAGGVAHDFNNILTGITGYSELALRSLRPSDEAFQQIQEVIHAANRATLLTKQLLTFSGRHVIDKHDIDLNEEVAKAVALAETVKLPGINLDLVAGTARPVVAADNGLLRQVLLNVIMNACEASDEAGRVEIRVLVSERGRAVVEVEDWGCGIARDVLPYVFDPFYTSKPRGHGLGLASARQILEDHGADISIGSSEGTGTLVRMTFPLAVAREPVGRTGEGQVGDQRTPVLVADDEESIRGLLKHLLTRAGYDVELAVDGVDCLRRFDWLEGDFHFVVLDLKMPGRDGWQCLEHIRAVKPELPVLIVSGYDPGGNNVLETDPNVVFLSKPFRMPELEASLARLLGEPLKLS